MSSIETGMLLGRQGLGVWGAAGAEFQQAAILKSATSEVVLFEAGSVQTEADTVPIDSHQIAQALDSRPDAYFIIDERGIGRNVDRAGLST